MGVLEGKAYDAPQPSLRGKSAYRRRLWEDRCFLMQNQTELSPGRDLLPALHKTCRIEEDPCHRRLHRWGRASDRMPLSPGWWTALKEAERFTPLSPRRQKDSFPCAHHQENQELPETGGEALWRRVKFCRGEGFEPLAPRC